MFRDGPCAQHLLHLLTAICVVGPDAGLDAIDYFEKRFPDLDKMPTSGNNANCAEWLLSITTKVPLSCQLQQ